MGTAEDLARLEQQLRELRIEYEQYFAGILKHEPVKRREEVARGIRRLSGTSFTNTALAFRLNTLVATFTTYSAYWDRIVRQIEEGTYARERFRLKLKERGPAPLAGGAEGAATGSAAGTEAGGSLPPGAGPAGPGAHAAGRQPLGGAASAGGEGASEGGAAGEVPAVRFRSGGDPDTQQLERLYEALVAAKRRAGEPVEGLERDRLAATIRAQLPAIAKRFNCREVEFRVVVEGGKAKLKATPK
ncbi:MAG TPA: MXAN_5187 C-terminal domain-containing protein [Thermodesulfobacteriota bacterium]|nr:MXAN_5187 C-terminal domain-containing protein [Thermodesulfobacteriota bacterium]